MSTRSTIIFEHYSKHTDQASRVQIYKHNDGYPSGVLPALFEIQQYVPYVGATFAPQITQMANGFVTVCTVNPMMDCEVKLAQPLAFELVPGDVQFVYVITNRITATVKAGNHPVFPDRWVSGVDDDPGVLSNVQEITVPVVLVYNWQHEWNSQIRDAGFVPVPLAVIPLTEVMHAEAKFDAVRTKHGGAWVMREDRYLPTDEHMAILLAAGNKAAETVYTTDLSNLLDELERLVAMGIVETTTDSIREYMQERFADAKKQRTAIVGKVLAEKKRSSHRIIPPEGYVFLVPIGQKKAHIAARFEPMSNGLRYGTCLCGIDVVQPAMSYNVLDVIDTRDHPLCLVCEAAIPPLQPDAAPEPAQKWEVGQDDLDQLFHVTREVEGDVETFSATLAKEFEGIANPTVGHGYTAWLAIRDLCERIGVEPSPLLLPPAGYLFGWEPGKKVYHLLRNGSRLVKPLNDNPAQGMQPLCRKQVNNGWIADSALVKRHSIKPCAECQRRMMDLQIDADAADAPEDLDALAEWAKDRTIYCTAWDLVGKFSTLVDTSHLIRVTHDQGLGSTTVWEDANALPSGNVKLGRLVPGRETGTVREVNRTLKAEHVVMLVPVVRKKINFR